MRYACLAAIVAFSSCASPDAPKGDRPAMIVAHLGREGGDRGAFEKIRASFSQRNPGYDVEWLPGVNKVDRDDAHRILFVQKGEGSATITGERTGAATSEVAVGDIVLLRPGTSLGLDHPVGFLSFTSPVPFPTELPPWVRPDWDPRITDTPGGCATEEGAYRRILLTWLKSKGPYIYHALNAHRVRITDSFSHYHPASNGFDEFYLVQMCQPGGRILTSPHVPEIENPSEIDREEAATLLESTELAVGDLVYLPRELMHRGVGGVLAQVITVPGFRPGAEIGVDHHLRRINETLNLKGNDALPYNRQASAGPVIR